MQKLRLLLFLLVPGAINAAQTIAITAPANGATNVNGAPLSVTGTSSGNLSPVYINIDGTRVAQVTTTSGGAWTYSYSTLGNGSHTINAVLSDSSFDQLASATNSFTVASAATISIATPSSGSTAATILPNTTTGTSSLASQSVDLLMDGVLWTNVPTDTNGAWSSTYPDVTNASHTITANLKMGGVTQATTTSTFTASNPMATTAETLAATLISKAVTPSSLAGKLGTQTAHGVLVAEGTNSALTTLAVGSNGQVLIGSGSNDPVFGTIGVSGPSTNSIQFSTGAGTLSIKANPVFGNVIVVDAVNGNDGTGAINGAPFLTVNAAITAAAGGNVAIWIMPGTYTLTSGITVPANVAVVGINANAVTIQMTSVVAGTDLVTMGTNTRLEHLTLSLQSAAHVQLRGIVFPGTTTSTAKVRNVNLTVDNSTASAGGTSTVVGIYSNGTGAPTGQAANVIDSIIVVKSAGLGTKRGILLDTAANTFNLAVGSILVTNAGGAGSYIGAETNFAGTVLNVTSGSLNGPTADVSQTAGTIQLIGTVLVNSNANGLSFTTEIMPSTIAFGATGNVPGGTPFLVPAGLNANAGNTEYFYRVSEACVAKALHIRAVTAPGTSATFTLRKNQVNTVLLAALTTTGVDSGNLSASFAAGDSLSLQVTAQSGSAAANVTALVDLY